MLYVNYSSIKLEKKKTSENHLPLSFNIYTHFSIGLCKQNQHIYPGEGLKASLCLARSLTHTDTHTFFKHKMGSYFTHCCTIAFFGLTEYHRQPCKSLHTDSKTSFLAVYSTHQHGCNQIHPPMP